MVQISFAIPVHELSPEEKHEIFDERWFEVGNACIKGQNKLSITLKNGRTIDVIISYSSPHRAGKGF